MKKKRERDRQREKRKGSCVMFCLQHGKRANNGWMECTIRCKKQRRKNQINTSSPTCFFLIIRNFQCYLEPLHILHVEHPPAVGRVLERVQDHSHEQVERDEEHDHAERVEEWEDRLAPAPVQRGAPWLVHEPAHGGVVGGVYDAPVQGLGSVVP